MRTGPPIFKIYAWYPSMSLAFPFARRLTPKYMSSDEKNSSVVRRVSKLYMPFGDS